MHVSTKGMDAALLVMNMVWWMRQRAPAVVGSVKRQIIRSQYVVAGSLSQVVAVAAHRQSLPLKRILFAQRQCQISAHRHRDLQSAANKGGFYGDGKLNVKIFGKGEGACEREIDGPTAIENRGALAALKRHSEIVL